RVNPTEALSHAGRHRWPRPRRTSKPDPNRVAMRRAMTTSILSSPVPQPADSAPQPARISFRQPVSATGFIDAAWWPRSCDLTTELPPLLDVLWTAAREITRISYHLSAWDPGDLARSEE